MTNLSYIHMYIYMVNHYVTVKPAYIFLYMYLLYTDIYWELGLSTVDISQSDW